VSSKSKLQQEPTAEGAGVSDSNPEETVLLESAVAGLDLPAAGGAHDSKKPSRSMPSFLRWGTKGGLAVFEQGVVSGSNFVMGVLLGRWMTPNAYGAYAYAFAMFILVSLLYQSIIIEPMAVFGANQYRHCLRGYLKSLLRMHLGTALAVFLILGLYAGYEWVAGGATGLPQALAGVTIAAPCVLLFWLGRRGFFLRFAPEIPAASSLFYSVLVIGLLFLLHRWNRITPFNAFVITAIAALLTSGLLLVLLYRMFRDSTEPTPGLRQDWQRHWVYGRWALAAALVAWFPANVYYPVLSHFYGLAETGQFRAIMNLVLPVQQTYGALSVLALAYAAKVHGEQGSSAAGKLSRRLTLLFIGGAVAYWGMIVPFGRPILNALYHGKYAEVAPLLPLFAAGSVLWAAVFGPVIMLRGMEAPRLVFVAHLGSSIACLVLGIPLTWKYGLVGVGWGLVVSSAVAFVIAVFLLRRQVRGMALAAG
jgi:O-antigen/teichoic acid export membrane protein